MSLSRRMAEFGFESNADYSLPLRLLLERPASTVRTLNICGEPGRRKTAFANALAAALECPHVLYHDFARPAEPPPASGDEDNTHPPIDPFDRVMSEGCALSEGEQTVVILDQLQATDFSQHLRLYDFLKTQQWHYLNASAVGNVQLLLLFLISEAPLYHSLQKLSLRVWVDASGAGRPPYQPADFRRDLRIAEVMERLGDVFESLGTVPTRSEYEKILYDVEHFIRTPEALIDSIYGWTEGVERPRLQAPPVIDRIVDAVDAIHQYIGIEALDV